MFCPETDGIYAVPIAEAPRGYGCLRVAAPTNNQAKGIRWAADYELPTAPDLHFPEMPA